MRPHSLVVCVSRAILKGPLAQLSSFVTQGEEDKEEATTGIMDCLVFICFTAMLLDSLTNNVILRRC